MAAQVEAAALQALVKGTPYVSVEATALQALVKGTPNAQVEALALQVLTSQPDPGATSPASAEGVAASVATSVGVGNFVAGTKISQDFAGSGVEVTSATAAGTFVAGSVSIAQDFTGAAAETAVTVGAGSFINTHPVAQSFTGTGVSFGATAGAGTYRALAPLPTIVEKVRYRGPRTSAVTLTFTQPPAADDVVVIVQITHEPGANVPTATGLGGTWATTVLSTSPGQHYVLTSTDRTAAGTVTINSTATGSDTVWFGYVVRGAEPVVSVVSRTSTNKAVDERGRGQVAFVSAYLDNGAGPLAPLEMPAYDSLPSPADWTADTPYVALAATGSTYAAGVAYAIPADTGLYRATATNPGNAASSFDTAVITVGTYANPQPFTGAGVSKGVTVGAGSFEAPTAYGIGSTLTVSTLKILDTVTMADVTLSVGGPLTVGTNIVPVVSMAGLVMAGGGSLSARPQQDVMPDPRRNAPQWRYVITDLANAPLGELVDIEHDAVEDGVGEPATMQFTIATDSDQHALIKPIERQCQVWEGDALRLRGPILPGQPSDDGTTMTYKIHDPSWFWRDGRRVITRTPQKNLLSNGDFRRGMGEWTGGYDADSIPKAAPKARVVEEDFVDDTDGLDPIKAMEITGVESVTEAELSSNAVFWPNLATFRPGGVASIETVANAMPETVGLKVTVIGHTANDGTGNGLGLSLRRADAAAAIIKKKRPGAVITTKGVGFYDPKPGFPIGSQEQRRVVIQYDQTISGKSKQWERRTVEVTQPKEARYPLVLTFAALLKVADDWSVPDANMTSLKAIARRKGVDGKPDAKLPWDEQLGQGSSSISDTDPVDRWIPQTAEVTIPADGRTYLVDVYLYAPAALARYTAVGLFPDEQLYFWGQDQALIFKGVMEHIQKPEFGYADLGVGTRAPLTGIKRDREFAFRDLTPADTALDGLMGISRGLEWDTVTTATRTTATTYYPRQGQSVDYVLALGSNVVAAVPANTRDVGSAIIAQAQGLGSYRAVAYANDKRAFGGTLIQRVVTAEQDTPINELGQTAKAELFWAHSSTPAYWVDIDPDSIVEVLAETAKGDTVRLILDYPEAVDRLARIVRRQIHPDSLRLMVAFEEV